MSRELQAFLAAGCSLTFLRTAPQFWPGQFDRGRRDLVHAQHLADRRARLPVGAQLHHASQLPHWTPHRRSGLLEQCKRDFARKSPGEATLTVLHIVTGDEFHAAERVQRQGAGADAGRCRLQPD